MSEFLKRMLEEDETDKRPTIDEVIEFIVDLIHKKDLNKRIAYVTEESTFYDSLTKN